MLDLKGLAPLICGAAVVLASCGTPGTSGAVPVNVIAPAPLAGAAAETAPAAAGTEVTIGTLTDPCALGLYDPWWTDHGGHVEFHRRCG